MLIIKGLTPKSTPTSKISITKLANYFRKLILQNKKWLKDRVINFNCCFSLFLQSKRECSTNSWTNSCLYTNFYIDNNSPWLCNGLFVNIWEEWDLDNSCTPRTWRCSDNFYLDMPYSCCAFHLVFQPPNKSNRIIDWNKKKYLVTTVFKNPRWILKNTSYK